MISTSPFSVNSLYVIVIIFHQWDPSRYLASFIWVVSITSVSINLSYELLRLRIKILWAKVELALIIPRDVKSMVASVWSFKVTRYLFTIVISLINEGLKVCEQRLHLVIRFICFNVCQRNAWAVRIRIIFSLETVLARIISTCGRRAFVTGNTLNLSRSLWSYGTYYTIYYNRGWEVS